MIEHQIDFSEGADDLDEISGDQQLALMWCNVHQIWEWHWVDIADLENYAGVRITTGNTMAPCVIIGERAADLIRQMHPM
jgi:hypothetical protein